MWGATIYVSDARQEELKNIESFIAQKGITVCPSMGCKPLPAGSSVKSQGQEVLRVSDGGYYLHSYSGYSFN